MSNYLGERVDSTTLRTELKEWEKHIHAAQVAVVVTFYGRNWWVFAPPESLAAFGPGQPERATVSDYHLNAVRMAQQVNTTQQPILVTRQGAHAWVMAPLASLDRIRTVLCPVNRAEQE